MSRSSTDRCRRAPGSPGGFTLIEILIAVTLMLMMMVLVASIFALMSDAIEGARAMVETSDRLRACRNKLQTDLAGIDGPLRPPHRPEDGRPYVEIIEGPMGACVPTEFANMDPALVSQALVNGQAVLDTTLGDMDDIVMFVTRSRGTPFVGKFLNDVGGGQPPRETTIQSQVAEVAWFLRGTTLYRRQLLVAPGIKPTFNNSVGNGLTIVNPWSRLSSGQTVAPFYKSNDLSVHQQYGPYLQQRDPKGVGDAMLVANTLGDLTNRQNRFAHQPYAYPYDVRFWGRLGLPTLSECSGASTDGKATNNAVLPFPYQQATNQTWLVERGSALNQPEIYPLLCPQSLVDGKELIVTSGPMPYRKINMDGVGGMVSWAGGFDAWTRPQPWGVVDTTPSPPKIYATTNHYTGAIEDFASPTRVSEDVILTNVLGFDVKVWDDNAPILMDTNDSRRVLEPGDSGYLALLASGNFQIVQFGAYVDLNYMCLLDQDGDGVIDYLAANPARRPQFADAGDLRSRLVGTAPFQKDFSDPESWPAFNALQPAVYDTWSTYYEHDGIDQDQDGVADEGANGIDDVPASPGQVDDVAELEAPPPYAAPLRGIQIKIRVFEPDTQQIREVTIRQDFVPE